MRFGHNGGVIWLTGLSGSGKSTLAMMLEEALHRRGCACYTLDGDILRKGLNSNLGFSPEDRAENVRRVGEVAALFAEAGFICITALISPYRDDRSKARGAAKRSQFHEIYLAADLITCERRDPKGLYLKARAFEIRNFTGIDAPYEIPLEQDLEVDTANRTPEQSHEVLLAYVLKAFPKCG